jgi:hypothetical protein
MSTSHYSSTSYSDLVGKPGIKSSDKNPALAQMREAIYAWEDPLSSSSIQHSRPEAGDVGLDTIRIPLAAVQNYRKASLRARYAALFALAAVLLMADGIALVTWTDSVVEHYVFACLAISAELLLIACAIGCRKL